MFENNHNGEEPTTCSKEREQNITERGRDEKREWNETKRQRDRERERDEKRGKRPHNTLNTNQSENVAWC
jgi:hypothetical protein